MILEGRVAAVTGARHALGRGLADALIDAGASVGEVDDDALCTREGAVTALEKVAGDHGGAVDIVLHAAMTDLAFEHIAFEDCDNTRWDAVWEGSMRAAIHVLQAGYAQMRQPVLRRPELREGGGGGRFVFVTPTVAMSGAPGLVPYTTAIEGQRLLAKSAARQWGPDGITVNCLAPAPEHIPIGVESTSVSLAPPALGGPGDVRRDLGPVAVFLASAASHALTGVTLCADGGVWMAP